MIRPAIAVAADVPIARSYSRSSGRVGLEGLGAAEDRHWHRKTSEEPMQPPETDAGAVFEHAFRSKVAARHAQIRAQHLGQPPLRDAVPGGIRKLRALLEIDDEIDRNAGVSGPLGMRRLGAIADEIAGHLASVVGSSARETGYQSC